MIYRTFTIMTVVSVVCFAVGLVLGFISGAATDFAKIDHDPTRQMQLYRSCLEVDNSVSTKYCRDFAEENSRVPVAKAGH